VGDRREVIRKLCSQLRESNCKRDEGKEQKNNPRVYQVERKRKEKNSLRTGPTYYRGVNRGLKSMDGRKRMSGGKDVKLLLETKARGEMTSGRSLN